MITIYFAPPGVGKSTLCARYAFFEHIKMKLGISKYDRVLCNYPVKYTYLFDKDSIGTWDMSSSLILMDESSIEFNNRDYKEMRQEKRDHFKLHRKYREDWVIFSQSYDDMDITIRRLCTEMYLLKKCTLLPYTVKALRIRKFVQVDDEHHTIVDGYSFDPWYLRIFTTRRYYLPFYWDMFDSWHAPKLPIKEYKYIE